jgi:hypothetical protein
MCVRVPVLSRVLIRRAAVVAGRLACDPFLVLVEHTHRRVLDPAVLSFGVLCRAPSADPLVRWSNDGGPEIQQHLAYPRRLDLVIRGICARCCSPTCGRFRSLARMSDCTWGTVE